jgi:hypothetical protein
MIDAARASQSDAVHYREMAAKLRELGVGFFASIRS